MPSARGSSTLRSTRNAAHANAESPGNKLGARRSSRRSEIKQSPEPVKDESDDENTKMVDEDEEEEPKPPPDDEADEDAATPQEDDDEEAESPPTVTTIPRRRRGRGGLRGLRHSSRRDSRTPEAVEQEGSESGTPFKRKRGRPAGSGRGTRGGFRGRRKGAPPEAPRVIDEYGNTLQVIDDEAVVDEDPDGDDKVDENGNLLGGREYRVRTFTIIGRGDRLYMLSTEPARCCGFRDSYLFFTKHPKLYKVLVAEDEKKDLIDRDILPNSYKGRNIGVVTARSVFREFGARIIVGGRRITDDYKEAEARANGEVEGELADPDDRIPENKEDYNRNRYVAWFGASEVYRNVGTTSGAQGGKPGLTGKRRNNITVQNWQHMHARESSRYNTTLTAFRNANLNGVYDTNTNMMFYPKIMQPTHAKWEQIPPPVTPAQAEQKLLTDGLPNGHHLPNGTSPQDDNTNIEEQPNRNSIFTEIPPIISRNFTVVDTVFTGPPISHAGYPGPDGHVADPASGPNGLDTVPDELVDELPEDCRVAFEQARQLERQWKQQWGTEAQSGLKGNLKIGFNGYPV